MRREQPQAYSATWPMLALMLLGLWSVLTQPYDPQAWSVFSAKYLVPFTLFHAAGFVFRDQSALRKLEAFSLVTLTYLSLTSVFFLFDAKSLIFPSFILDESIGIHADRARGPFLQAVANGVSLNLLAVIALDCFRRRRLGGWLAALLLPAVPLALLATKTRAVWLSAAISIAGLALVGPTQRLRRAALVVCALCLFGLFGILLYQTSSASLAERFVDRSPLDFRTDMYRAGWQMFTERPLAGWGTRPPFNPKSQKDRQLPSRVLRVS